MKESNFNVGIKIKLSETVRDEGEVNMNHKIEHKLAPEPKYTLKVDQMKVGQYALLESGFYVIKTDEGRVVFLGDGSSGMHSSANIKTLLQPGSTLTIEVKK